MHQNLGLSQASERGLSKPHQSNTQGALLDNNLQRSEPKLRGSKTSNRRSTMSLSSAQHLSRKTIFKRSCQRRSNTRPQGMMIPTLSILMRNNWWLTIKAMRIGRDKSTLTNRASPILFLTRAMSNNSRMGSSRSQVLAREHMLTLRKRDREATVGPRLNTPPPKLKFLQGIWPPASSLEPSIEKRPLSKCQ